jgi:hypothetical protein
MKNVVGGNLQPGGGMHPPNLSLGRVWGKSRDAWSRGVRTQEVDGVLEWFRPSA